MKTKKEQKQLKKDIELLRRISKYSFDVEYRTFIRLEEELNKIIKWSKIPKEKRNLSTDNWTSSPQRQIGSIIENLEFKINKLKMENKLK